MKVLQVLSVIILNLLLQISCEKSDSKEIEQNNTKQFSISQSGCNENNVDYQKLSKLCSTLNITTSTKNESSLHRHNNNNHHENDDDSRSLVWIYGTVAITAISLCGLAGVLVIPIVDKQFYFYVLQFFMALAVGTLTGDSLMHLLPHSIQPSSDDFDSSELHMKIMQKGIAMMLGIMIFWFIERILKLITERKSNKNHQNEVKRLDVDHKHGHSHGSFDVKSESLSSIVWMVVLGDGLHNFTDGMTIGAAFSHSIAGGFSTTVAVLCHELPHELGDFAVLLKAGMPAKQAIFYNILSSILSFFGMCMGIMFGDTPETSKWVFAVAAGLFIYIALVDMIPELSNHKDERITMLQISLQTAGMISGFACMLLISIYEHELEELFI